MHQKLFLATARLWASAGELSLPKKLLDGGDQLLGSAQVLLVVKVGHPLRFDFGRRNHTVTEHAVHVLGALAPAAGVAALIVEVIVPGGRHALQRELLLPDGDFFGLCHIFSISPFRQAFGPFRPCLAGHYLYSRDGTKMVTV